MSTAHATCCCPETLTDLGALKAAYESAGRDRVNLTHRLNQAAAGLKALKAELKADHEAAKSDRDELANRLNQALTNYLALRSAYWAANCDRDELANALAAAVAERDRARDTAARLEAELARGFRTAAPDVTLSHDNGPATPDNPEFVNGIVQIRPGSENTPADTYPPKNGPESPETPVTARTPPAAPDHSDERAL